MSKALTLPKNSELDRGTVDHILKSRHSLAQSWELIPRDKLSEIIAGLELAATPCDKAKAKETGDILLGCYPRHNIENPEVYVRGLVSVLMKFPSHVGTAAVDRLTLESTFLPTRAELNKHCETIMGELNVARSIARRMAQEHDRREKEQQEADRIAASKKEFREKHGGKSPLEVLAAEGFAIGGKTEEALRDKANRKAAKQEAAQRRNNS